MPVMHIYIYIYIYFFFFNAAWPKSVDPTLLSKLCQRRVIRRVWGRLKAISHISCRAHAVPLPCHAHAPLWPCRSSQGHATARPSLDGHAVLWPWEERHGRSMASVNQTRLHCVNHKGKTHSKPLAARHGRGMAWVRHGHGMLYVNRPLTVDDGRQKKDRSGNICGRSIKILLERRTSANRSSRKRNAVISWESSVSRRTNVDISVGALPLVWEVHKLLVERLPDHLCN